MPDITGMGIKRMSGFAPSQQTQLQVHHSTRTAGGKGHVLDDLVLLGLMPLIAGCGLIYEYALSHYAGIVLGNTETAIFIMIGIMIMSAGFGSLVSQSIPDAFMGMVWLEIAMVVVGSSSVPAISGTVYLTQSFDLPTFVFKSKTVGIDVFVPYVFGFLMGFLMGMEMPLVARIRERIRGAEGARGTAMVYASDCIGIAAGTFAWAAYLGELEVTAAAVAAATVNVLALTLFALRYRSRIAINAQLALSFAGALLIVTLISSHGAHWRDRIDPVAAVATLASKG